MAKNVNCATRGFSLIELLVVVSILAVISSVILINHSRFNSSVLLGSLAYDIALSVRQAQVYGLSVQQYASAFQIGYGIHFSDVGSYFLFADLNANRRYDEETDSIIETYTIGRGHFVSRFCGVTSENAEECSDSSVPIDHLDVVFFRPDPDAIMTAGGATIYSESFITVASPSGETRTVTIASTGQISVQNL